MKKAANRQPFFLTYKSLKKTYSRIILLIAD